MLMAVNKSEFV